VKPDHIATFRGRKLSPLYQGEMGNRFNPRIEGTRIKHTMGPVSLKMDDQFGLILRIEVTVNDVSFFQPYRTVEQRDGQTVPRSVSENCQNRLFGDEESISYRPKMPQKLNSRTRS
jgi:hypothetical protein